MADYTLSCFGQSGNAFKAALALNLAGADWTPRFVDFFGGEHRSPEFMARNEMARVPVLERKGEVWSESGLILHVIARTTGKLGPADQAEADEILRWILWDNYAFTSVIAPARFLSRFVPEEKRPAGAVPFLLGRLRPSLQVLEDRLADRDFIATPGPSIADCSLAGYLFYGEELPFDLAEYPNITAWQARLRALPGFVPPYALMPTKG